MQNGKIEVVVGGSVILMDPDKKMISDAVRGKGILDATEAANRKAWDAHVASLRTRRGAAPEKPADKKTMTQTNKPQKSHTKAL